MMFVVSVLIIKKNQYYFNISEALILFSYFIRSLIVTFSNPCHDELLYSIKHIIIYIHEAKQKC